MNDKIIDGEVWFAPDNQTLEEYIGQEVIFFRNEGWVKCRGILIKVEYPDPQNRDPRIDIQIDDRHEIWWAAKHDSDSWVVFVRRNSIPIPLTNKGRETCIKCRIPTEMKRDFSDMSIREFCPRCKI